MNCSVCGKVIDQGTSVNVLYSYILHVDTLCDDCMTWADTTMRSKCQELSLEQPYITWLNPHIMKYIDPALGTFYTPKWTKYREEHNWVWWVWHEVLSSNPGAHINPTVVKVQKITK